MAVLPAIAAVLLRHCVMDILNAVVLLANGIADLAVLSSVTAVHLHHSAMDTCTDYSVVSLG